MLTFIDVKFIFDSALLGLFSSANILQIADVDRPLSCVHAVRSCHVFSYNFAWFLLLKRMKCPPFFVFTIKPKTTQPHPQVFLVNGALTCKNAEFLT